MKIIFLSDIHANWFYLSKIIPLIEFEEPDFIFFLGDAIGYYENPEKVLTWLREVNAFCIKGNHEQYSLGEIQYCSTNEKLYKVQEHKNKLSDTNIKFIQSWTNKLQIEIEGKKFLMVHGAQDNSEKYVYTCSDIDKSILRKYDYYVYGHTHIPLIQYYFGCCVINPGSIGQPRDYTSKPSFVLLNLDTSEVSIKKISVNTKSYIQYLHQKNYDERVINILTRLYS
jgi:putative phosphoesterase